MSKKKVASETKTGKKKECKKKEEKTSKGRKISSKAKKSTSWSSSGDWEWLKTLGLYVREVTADGNCFFRAVSDQLFGSEDHFDTLRSRIVSYMTEHEADFAPFVEDDVSFEEYCFSMERDGTWAGNIELQAASMLLKCNFCIHRLEEPRWYIKNFSEDHRTIHLSYHDGEHYNSVRLLDDNTSEPAKQINIEADSGTTGNSSKENDAKTWLNDIQVNFEEDEEEGKEECSSCPEVEFKAGGISEPEGTPAVEGASGHETKSEQSTSQSKLKSKEANNSSADQVLHGKPKKSNLSPQTKAKIGRNQSCPCGSKKKYKSCCGTFTRVSAEPSQLPTRQSNRPKQKQQDLEASKEKMYIGEVSSQNPHNVGALCI